MSEAAIPEKVHRWWPVVTAVLMASGFISSAVGYYAKNETEKMVKAGLIEPLKDFNMRTDRIEDQMKAMERNQIETDAKLKLLLELMQKNNRLLDQQNRSLEELSK